MLKSAALAIFLAAFWSVAAGAATMQSLAEPDIDNLGINVFGSKACLLSGQVEKGDLEKIKAHVGVRQPGVKGKIKCEIVYLDSPGGHFFEALEIMDYFFKSMIATSVQNGDSCYSACAIIWLGGAVPGGHSMNNPHAYRRMEPGAILGFHAPYPVLPDGNYSNDTVTEYFVNAFSITQNLLQVFQDRKIPLWFAGNLMHPDISNFYFIDNIEKANLIGASLWFGETHLDVMTTEMIARTCYNLSHWGKGLPAHGQNKTYSNNETDFRNFDDYHAWLNRQAGRQLFHKFVFSVRYFINTRSILDESVSRDLIDGLGRLEGTLETIPDGDGGQEVFWERLAAQMQTRAKPIRPGFLYGIGEEYSIAPHWYLFQSPGVVGPNDENVRDRPELCLISLREEDRDGRRVFLSSSSGSEFHSIQELERLPASILGLPAETRLENVYAALGITPGSAGNFAKPDWCKKAASVAETTICSDRILARADMNFAKNYTKASAKNKKRALQTARALFKRRDSCGRDKDCMLRAFNEFAGELNKIIYAN